MNELNSFENIIIKKFFTEQMCKEIISYINSYAKIFPYCELNNIKYKKNLDYINNIHYQINSYFQKILNLNVKPQNNYLQKYNKNILNIFESTPKAFCYHYFLSNCTISIDNLADIDISMNEGILCKSSNFINVDSDKEVYVISFYFIHDEVNNYENNK